MPAVSAASSWPGRPPAATASPRQALTSVPASVTTAPGKGVEGAQLARQHGGRLGPVEPGLGLVDLAGVGDAGLGLHHGKQLIETRQGVDHEFAAQCGKAVVQAAGTVLRIDGHGLGQQHGAAVESGFHLHDGDAGLRVARLDRAMDRRRAAPARQQRSMDVDAAARRQVEHGLRQDQAVGGHHHQFGAALDAGGADRLVRRRILEPLGLGHRNGVRQGDFLYGGGLQHHAAPGRAVGLGQHQHHLVSGGEQGFQCRRGELRRAGEDYFHRAALRAFEEIVASGPQRGAAGAQLPECTSLYMRAKRGFAKHASRRRSRPAVQSRPWKSTAQAPIRHAQ